MRKLALLFVAARAAFGIVLMVRPKTMSRGWIGEDAERPGPEMLVRSIGARDFVIGIGGVLAIVNGAPARGWLEAGVMADLFDTVITTAYIGKTPAQGSAVTLAMTTIAGSVGYRLATRVDRALDAPEEPVRAS
jgi:hypothetical protein